MNIPFCLFLFTFFSSTAVPSIDSRFINSWDLCWEVKKRGSEVKTETIEKGFCQVILMSEQFLSPAASCGKSESS